MRAGPLIALLSLLIVGSTVATGSVVAVPGVDEDVDCDDEIEITTDVFGDEVVQNESVSKAWYQNLEHVRDVREDFDEAFPVDEIEWLYSVGIATVDEPICEMNQNAIGLGVADEETALEELGESFDGVPIVIEEHEPISPASEGAGDDGDDDTDDTAGWDAVSGFGIVSVVVGLITVSLFALYRTGRVGDL